MQWKGLMIVLTGMSVLCVIGCSSTRSVTAHESVKATTNFTNYTNERDSVFVEVRDTLLEITTITVRENEQGDTLRLTTVTDRTRASVRDRVKDVEVKVVEKHDTVYIEHRDSVYAETLRQAQGDSGGRKPAWLQGMKWVFWIIVAIGGLIITITKTIRR